jgi:hypothetical protein
MLRASNVALLPFQTYTAKCKSKTRHAPRSRRERFSSPPFCASVTVKITTNKIQQSPCPRAF